MFDESPLYTALYSANVKYTTCFDGKDLTPFSVPGNETHARLYRANMQFRADMASIYPGKNGQASKKLSKKNTLTAAITILHTDAHVEEGEIANIDTTTIDYELPDVSTYIINTPSTFEHYTDPVLQAACSFNNRIQNHINLSGVSQYSLEKCNLVLDISKIKPGVIFDTTFHHTEQSYMNSMYGIENMHTLKIEMRRTRVQTVLGIINELNSFLPVCANCNAGLIGFQNTKEKGYIAEFVQYLNGNTNEAVVRLPDTGLGMHTRVSCTYQADSPKKEMHIPLTRSRTQPIGNTATANPLTLGYASRNKIVQCYADVGDIHRIASGTTDTFRGDYFTSSDLKNTIKFENYKAAQRKR